uniref:Tpr-like protein n=2 Tax=Tetraselmis sp. GSL018 TaxID=582737 RepID=A0A061S9Z0_9CHLO
MTEDAIRVLLRLLVDRPKSKEVRRSLAEAVSKPGMLDAMVSELTGEAYTAAALAFLATCVKDHGAIEAAIELFRRADSLSPCPSYALNLIHTEELLLQFERCIEDVRRFCERSPDILSVASVSLADVAEELEGLARADSAVSVWQSAGALSDGRPDGELPSPSIEVEYSSDELDAIAVVMTAAKVLFVGGALSAADGVVRRIEPAVAASVKPLHTTLIRNEAAYLGCVKQILRGPHRPADPGASSLRPLFLAGDSHSLSGAWQQVSLRGEQRVLVPKLVTGCKIWHTRPESVFYPKAGFESTMASIPDGSQVVMLFGEIDCREGLLLAVEKCKYDSLEEAIAATVHIYLEALRRLLGRGMEIFVHPLPPVLNETRHIVLPFNAALRRAVDEAARDPSAGGRLHWLDFLDELLTPDGKRLNPALEFDGTHLSPAYVRHLDAALGAVP